MDALVSDHGNGALLRQSGSHAWLDAAGRRSDVSDGDLHRFLRQRGTFYAFEADDEREVVEEIRLARDVHEALMCTATLLSDRVAQEAREVSAEELEKVLANAAVSQRIEYILWAEEFPAHADFKNARGIAKGSGCTRAARLLADLADEQPAIAEVHRAWQAIPKTTFADGVSRDDVRYFAIRDGWFRFVVERLKAGEAFDLHFRRLLEKKTRLEVVDVAALLKEWFAEWVNVAATASAVRKAPATATASPRRQQSYLLSQRSNAGAMIEKQQANQREASSFRHVILRQIGSPIHHPVRVRETLKALGLKKMHQVSERVDTPETWGMINKVRHLVEILGIR